MNKIIYLEGSRAVGKSTLLSNIKKHHPEVVVIDGAARKEFMFDNSILNEFIINEKLYLACAVAQYKVLKTLDTIAVIVKGPFTDAFYAETYGERVFGEQFLCNNLNEYIDMAKQCEPDMIVYLDAPKSVIYERFSLDTKRRTSMNTFLEEWLDDFDKYYKSNPKTVIIDTTNKEPDDVYKEFYRLVDGLKGDGR